MDTSAYRKDKTYVLEFPGLETIDLANPEIQREIVKWGFAVNAPTGELIFTKNVKLVAGGEL